MTVVIVMILMMIIMIIMIVIITHTHTLKTTCLLAQSTPRSRGREMQHGQAGHRHALVTDLASTNQQAGITRSFTSKVDSPQSSRSSCEINTYMQ